MNNQLTATTTTVLLSDIVNGQLVDKNYLRLSPANLVQALSTAGFMKQAEAVRETGRFTVFLNVLTVRELEKMDSVDAIHQSAFMDQSAMHYGGGQGRPGANATFFANGVAEGVRVNLHYQNHLGGYGNVQMHPTILVTQALAHLNAKPCPDYGFGPIDE